MHEYSYKDGLKDGFSWRKMVRHDVSHSEVKDTCRNMAETLRSRFDSSGKRDVTALGAYFNSCIQPDVICTVQGEHVVDKCVK